MNIKKVNFKTFEKIVHDEIKLAQNRYYLNSFTAKKNNMKKTWATINKTFNIGIENQTTSL